MAKRERKKNKDRSMWHFYMKGIFAPIPVTTLIIAIIFFSSPVDIPEAFSICQAFLIINIIYFSIWHPIYLPAIAIFVIGLLFDLTNSLPMGSSAFTFLILQYFSQTIRYSLMQMHFLFAWLIISLLGFSCAVVEWGLMSILHLHFLDALPLLFEGLACIGLYPLIFASLSAIIGIDNTEEMS